MGGKGTAIINNNQNQFISSGFSKLEQNQSNINDYEEDPRISVNKNKIYEDVL